MKFMMIVKDNKDSETGKMPSEVLLSAMGKYNEEKVKKSKFGVSILPDVVRRMNRAEELAPVQKR